MKITTERLDLAKVAPLERPLCVNFELTTRCNFACEFCPIAQPTERERTGFRRLDMKPELFKRVVDQLKEYPESEYPFKAYYNGMGESTILPDFIDLVKYSVAKNVFSAHIIRTNGSMLKPEFNRKLIDAGFTNINISIEAVSEEGYRKVTRRKDVFDKVVAGVRDLYEHKGNCHIFTKIIPLGDEYTDVDEFKKIFAPISDEADIEYPMKWNNGMLYDTSRGLNKSEITINGDPITPNVACPYTFYTIIVRVGGIISMCCFDWSTQVNVGDINDNTIQEIWNGPKMREFWKMQLEGRRFENPACKDCQFVYGAPDYLSEEQRKEILCRL